MRVLKIVLFLVSLVPLCWAGGKTPAPPKTTIPPTPKPTTQPTTPKPTTPPTTPKPPPKPTTTTAKPITKPNITTAARSITVTSGSDIKLTCIGEMKMRWEAEVVPKMENDDSRRQVTNTVDKNNKLPHTSVFVYKRAKYTHTGRYYCAYVDKPNIRTSIYVYVTDNSHMFRPYNDAEYKKPSDVTRIPIRAGYDIRIPCLLTNPDADVKLFRNDEKKDMYAAYRPDVGFMFRYDVKHKDTRFRCQAEYLGRKTDKKYVTYEEFSDEEE